MAGSQDGIRTHTATTEMTGVISVDLAMAYRLVHRLVKVTLLVVESDGIVRGKRPYFSARME